MFPTDWHSSTWLTCAANAKSRCITGLCDCARNAVAELNAGPTGKGGGIPSKASHMTVKVEYIGRRNG